MDDLKKSLNNISLYDVKAYVRKAQNAVYNYTEMEAKVREATNNEPWGASSTLMQKIAAGTYNYREREEIVGMIFRRFTEKSSNEWRQIYKALQLLEYLIKNGSERLVDDARSNLSLIQMLRSFHYIDSKGRDQGINVRTKSKTLVELLNNDSILRTERKKSRENAKKFQGVAGGISSSVPLDDDDEYGTYENRIFGDGGVYGQRFEETRASGKKDFEEYDVESGSSAHKPSVSIPKSTNKPTPAPNNPQVDLFSFDDAPQQTTSSNNNATNDDEFDEFGDFQTSVQPQPQTQPQAKPNNLSNNLSNLYSQNQSFQPASSEADSSFGEFTSFVSSAPATTATTSTFPSSSTNNNVSYSFGDNLGASSGPAHVAPKQDAFSSLFQSATAHGSIKPKTTPYNKTTAANTTTANNFTSNSYSAPQHQQGAHNLQQQNSSNGGEINLLDL